MEKERIPPPRLRLRPPPRPQPRPQQGPKLGRLRDTPTR